MFRCAARFMHQTTNIVMIMAKKTALLDAIMAIIGVERVFLVALVVV